MWDKVVSSKSPQRSDIFTRPKPAYTSPNPKQKRTDVAVVGSAERSYEESPSKVMERKRNQLNRPFKSKIDRKQFKKPPSMVSKENSLVVSMQSSASKT